MGVSLQYIFIIFVPARIAQSVKSLTYQDSGQGFDSKQNHVYQWYKRNSVSGQLAAKEISGCTTRGKS